MELVRRSLLVLTLVAASTLSFARPVNADPTIIGDEATFLAAHPIVSTEDFGTPTIFPPDQKTVSFQQVQYTSIDTIDPFWVVGDGLYRRFSDGSNTTDLRIDFEGGTFVTAFGFRLRAFGSPNQFAVIVHGRGGTTTTVNLAPSIVNVFVGISDPAGIRAVTITQRPDLAGGGETNFALESASRTALLADPVDGSRPKITGGGQSLDTDSSSRGRAVVAFTSQARADGVPGIHPTLGLPVTVFPASGHVQLVVRPGPGVPAERFNGAVVCIANLGPASRLGAGGDPDANVWEIRAATPTAHGIRYRSIAVQDAASGDFTDHEVGLGTDASCGRMTNARLERHISGQIVVHRNRP